MQVLLASNVKENMKTIIRLLTEDYKDEAVKIIVDESDFWNNLKAFDNIKFKDAISNRAEKVYFSCRNPEFISGYRAESSATSFLEELIMLREGRINSYNSQFDLHRYLNRNVCVYSDEDNDKAFIYYVDNNYNSILLKEINMLEYSGLVGFLASLFEKFTDSDGYTSLHKNLAIYCDDSISEEHLEQIKHTIRCKWYSYTILEHKNL